MKTLDIHTWVTPNCTVGTLRLGAFRCFTLELPWVDNTQNISCIPAGEYQGKLYESYKHGQVVLIEGVPDRTFIEIHAGNFTRDVQGCILVGDSIKYLDGDNIMDVTRSLQTLRKLISRLPETFTVNITRAFSPKVS